MTNSLKAIISAIVGGCGFLIFLFGLQTGILAAMSVGVISYIGTSMVLGTSSNEQLPQGVNLPKNELAESTIEEATIKLNKISYYGSQISNRNLKAKVEAICAGTVKIFNNLRKDPRDLKPAQKFLSYYLDATANILEKYLDISEKQLNDAEIQTRLIKIEETLELIRRTFDNQMVKFLENDMIDLDAEISVLQSTIKMDGF